MTVISNKLRLMMFFAVCGLSCICDGVADRPCVDAHFSRESRAPVYVVAIDYHGLLADFDHERLAKYLSSWKGVRSAFYQLISGPSLAFKYMRYKYKHNKKPTIENLFKEGSWLEGYKDTFVTFANMYRENTAVTDVLRQIRQEAEEQGKRVVYVLASNIGPMALQEIKKRAPQNRLYGIIDEYETPSKANGWQNKDSQGYFDTLGKHMKAYATSQEGAKESVRVRTCFIDHKKANCQKAEQTKAHASSDEDAGIDEVHCYEDPQGLADFLRDFVELNESAKSGA